MHEQGQSRNTVYTATMSQEASLGAVDHPQLGQLDALIFDMDGVLVDSEPLHLRAKREALSKAGILAPESLFANYIGRSDKAMIYEVAAAHGLSAERSDEILESKRRIYE
jgi:beta-phosphoglucomutase-like phosphatase (HAD superfamily)